MSETPSLCIGSDGDSRVEPYTGLVWTRRANDPVSARLVATSRTMGRRVIDEQTWASWPEPSVSGQEDA